MMLEFIVGFFEGVINVLLAVLPDSPFQDLELNSLPQVGSS